MPSPYINRHSPYESGRGRTARHGTVTSEGYLPHYPYYNIHLPVKLVVRNAKQYCEPLRVNGRLAYVLPDGSLYVP